MHAGDDVVFHAAYSILDKLNAPAEGALTRVIVLLGRLVRSIEVMADDASVVVRLSSGEAFEGADAAAAAERLAAWVVARAPPSSGERERGDRECAVDEEDALCALMARTGLSAGVATC